MDRIGALEHDFMEITAAIQQTFNEIGQRTQAMAEVLDAVVSLVGKDAVQKTITDAQDARLNENAQKAKDGLTKALEVGQIVPVTEGIGEDCIITGVEKDKDGNPVKPGYVQAAVSAVKPEFKEKMLLQNVGFNFPTEVGSFEITGIFRTVAPKAPEVPPAEQNGATA
jgi:hypothetical protein